MSMLSIFGGKSTTWSLTPQGKEKAEKYEGEGGLFEVLHSLDENGPSTTGEISRNTGQSSSKVKIIVKVLKKQGRIAKARGGDDA